MVTTSLCHSEGTGSIPVRTANPVNPDGIGHPSALYPEPLRVLGERSRRLERKPRVRPLVSRHDEVGHRWHKGTHETITLALRQPGPYVARGRELRLILQLFSHYEEKYYRINDFVLKTTSAPI